MKVQIRFRDAKKSRDSQTTVVDLALLPKAGDQIAIEAKPYKVESVLLLPRDNEGSPAALIDAVLVKKNPISLTFTDPL